MMMGPGSYIAEHIQGKTLEEANREVKRLRMEIRRLKSTLEDESQPEGVMVHPSPEVRISVYRDYIEAARAYFEEQGWEYEPSKEEIKDQEFNESLDQLERIEVRYGGYLSRIISLTINFEGDEIKADRIDMPHINLEDLIKIYFENVTREELLDEIRELHMGEWKRRYDNSDVLDGIQWSVRFLYDDGRECKYYGSNKYPYNFGRFLDVMEIEPFSVNGEDADCLAELRGS